MKTVDLLAMPGAPKVAHPVTPGEMYGPIPEDRDTWRSRFTVPFDYSGYPTISMPCGLSGDGLPLSLQIAGHPLSEPILVQTADAFERATEWHTMHPPGW